MGSSMIACMWCMISLARRSTPLPPLERDGSLAGCIWTRAAAGDAMKRILRSLKHKILFKELPPPYRENEDVIGDPQETYDPNPIPPCEVLDLLANCKVNPDSDVEYAEIPDPQHSQEMGVWHSTPLAHRHKSKISLTWVLKENAEGAKPQNDARYQRQFEDRFKNTKLRETRVVGRNEYYHNLRFRSACEEFVSQDTLSDETSTEEYVRRKHRHRHRRKKRQERFGYDIRDLDSFLSEASIDRPGNIPVVIAYPTTLYQTQKELQKELTLPLGTVVNAVFKNKQWLYAQTPHGDEGYVMYSACLPLGILPNRTSPQKKTPCWESSTDIYPRPCGNLTDNEKEQLRTRTRSESRYKQRKARCAEKDFDSLYLRTKSACSNIDNIEKNKYSTIDKRRTKRQTLLVVNSDFKGSVLNKTLSVREGDVVVLLEGVGETDVDADWFYVRKRDGSQGFIPAVIAGNGYI